MNCQLWYCYVFLERYFILLPSCQYTVCTDNKISGFFFKLNQELMMSSYRHVYSLGYLLQLYIVASIMYRLQKKQM